MSATAGRARAAANALLRLRRIAKEPPFRLLARAFVKAVPVSLRVKADWDAVLRPHYLVGLLTAAEEALSEGVNSICAIEFGVGGGSGLLALAEYAEGVARATGVTIYVYGFDLAVGLPSFCVDYRDHPDQWRPGDYPMDEESLRRRLAGRAVLVLGDVADTVPTFVGELQRLPVGFIAVDLDLYSSTREALKVLTLPGKRMLRHVVMYFDDVDFMFCHRYAGELLAIDEFNATNATVKIDVWRGVENGRALPDAAWLKKMYLAHDLDAISGVVLDRPVGQLPMTGRYAP